MPIRKFIQWLGLSPKVQAPPDVQASFLLKYDRLVVGTLSVREGKWKFEYSDDFRRCDALRPIIEFPDVAKTYESNELWQFFASRIPSIAQAEVETILRQEHIDQDDAVSLLKRFGTRTIANPFELEAAS